MIHPLVLGITILDVLAMALLIVAAVGAERVLRGWAPGSASANQLRLERGLEAAGLFAGGGAIILVLSTGLLILAVTAILPELVPGAMCGTGVMAATEGKGAQALTLRGLSLVLLAVWFVLHRLDRASAQAPLAPLVSLALVVATPMSLWAAVDTARALWALDAHGAVDCCSALYAEAHGAGGAGAQASVLALGAYFGGALILVLGWLRVGMKATLRGWALAPWVLGALAWVPLAQDVLIRHLAAYHYEVLAHHCPWCLFLPEHGAVGYVLFAALGTVVLQAVSAATASFAVGSATAVRDDARDRIRKSALWVVIGVAVFVGLSVGPAVVWWLRFGVWMH